MKSENGNLIIEKKTILTCFTTKELIDEIAKRNGNGLEYVIFEVLKEKFQSDDATRS
ncbi:hypothetical protein [Cetobacterium sp.]|uniref:hypothetical protein n=1 Tax=Cetobacterium sp. TaxID=2071632 RepID=UPI003F2DF90A